MYMYHSFLIHSSTDGHLGCYHVLTIINSAVMKIGVHVSLSILVSSLCMPSHGIAGSYGSAISSFLRKYVLKSNTINYASFFYNYFIYSDKFSSCKLHYSKLLEVFKTVINILKIFFKKCNSL